MRHASFVVSFSLLLVCTPLAHCVGDSTVIPQDGGNDGTPPSDSGPSGDAATDNSSEAGPPPGLYADATNGNDSNPGTFAQPLKTLKKALSLAKSGDHVYLFAGTYGAANGDDYATPIGDGVLVAGLAAADGGSSGVTLSGSNTSLTFAGSGGLENVAMTGFNVAIAASTGTQTLSKIGVTSGTAFALTGSAALTVTGLSLAGGALGGTVKNTSQLSVAGGTVAAATSGTAGSFACTDTAKMNVDSVTFTSPTGTVFVFDTSCTAVVSKSSITGLSSAGIGVSAKNNANVTLDTVTVDGGCAVSALGGTMTITGGSFTNSPTQTDEIVEGSAAITITGLSISTCGRFGIEGGSSGSVTATSMSITGCAVGGIYTQGTLKLRSCTIKNNVGTGVYAFTSSFNADLGTTNSLGNNTFQNNSTTNLYVAGAGTTTYAVGNTWNPSVQNADSSGHYGAGYSITNSNGTNFNVGTQPLRLGQ